MTTGTEVVASQFGRSLEGVDTGHAYHVTLRN